MRRPTITRRRVVGLAMMADHVRPLANTRGNTKTLFKLPPDERESVRAALKYIDALVKWERSRKA